MRQIVTKDGFSYQGRTQDFTDNGDHIVLRNHHGLERIYKINIASDSESYYEEDANTITGVLIFIAAIMLLIILLNGTGN